MGPLQETAVQDAVHGVVSVSSHADGRSACRPFSRSVAERNFRLEDKFLIAMQSLSVITR